ncbi:MAG TPA: peptide chain release factor N(5)-glutamine methyltransferase [Candidatus Cybelea sp.]|nr:peptide chain release factor N(5)-glutamine methyltransferase [Candidatus Cybelea sp.]
MTGGPSPGKQARAVSVRDALREGISRLREARVPSDALAAELLLMHSLAHDRAWLYSHPESVVEPGDAERYFALVARRAGGEPTQYLTGKQEFWGLEFEVNPHVLIPRPETEHVVEVALARLSTSRGRANRHQGMPGGPLRIADVGTGSGSIAVALARELPQAQIFATDISGAALEVARRNALRHGVRDRIHFAQGDLLQGVPERGRNLDLIASNPPYVARDEADGLAREVREHEPYAALFGGAAGTEIYARLIEQSVSVLFPGGILVLELGHQCASHVRSLLAHATWAAVEIVNDLAGIPRVISAQKTEDSSR